MPARATASVDGELIDPKARNLQNKPRLGVVRVLPMTQAPLGRSSPVDHGNRRECPASNDQNLWMVLGLVT